MAVVERINRAMNNWLERTFACGRKPNYSIDVPANTTTLDSPGGTLDAVLMFNRRRGEEVESRELYTEMQ